MFKKEELSFEQKIDYIYNDIRLKRTWMFFKWFFRLIIFWILVHFYFNAWPSLDKEKITEEVSTKITDAMFPVVEKMTNNMLDDLRTDFIENNK